MEFYNNRRNIKKNISFREFRVEDAPEIVKCLKDAYKESYVKPYLYTPEKIVDLYNKDELIFTIAENPEDGVIGMLGNERSKNFKNQNEFVTQVILKEYKGFGIAKAHIVYNLEHINQQGYMAFFGHALGSHVISQLTFTQLGFTACGFILSVFDQEKFLTGYQHKANKKISQAVILRPIIREKRPTLYIPSELYSIIKKTYLELGIAYEFLEDVEYPRLEYSELHIENNEVHHTLTIYIHSCGEDFRDVIKKLIEAYEQIELQTINIFLNMENINAVKGYQILRKLGFFFTGLQPLGEDFEYMILHHPLDVMVDISIIPYIELYQEYVDFIEKEISVYAKK